MPILATSATRVVVQGITGRYASDQTRMMLSYGTKVVAGVTPGRGGAVVHGVPVYDFVAEVPSVAEPPVASVVYAPPAFALQAVLEALEAGIRLLVVPTERVPVHDQMRIRHAARSAGAWVVGPNTAGMIVPGETLLGSIAPAYSSRGEIGVISRSGTLTHETVRALTRAGLGQSTSVHIGGDPVIGRNTVEYLRLFAADRDTKAVVLVGEIGGDLEEEAAEELGELDLPLVAFVAGRSAPMGRRMGHAGALVRPGGGSAQAKIAALEAAGATVAASPWEVPEAIRAVLSQAKLPAWEPRAL